MVSNYITSSQLIETKVFSFFFCLVALIDKALNAAGREHRAPPGFPFL